MKEHARATGCQPRLAAIHEASNQGAEIESSWRASSLVMGSRSFHGTAGIASGTRPPPPPPPPPGGGGGGGGAVSAAGGGGRGGLDPCGARRGGGGRPGR